MEMGGYSQRRRDWGGGVRGDGSIEWAKSLREGFSSMPTASLRVEVTVIVGAWVECVWLGFEPAEGDRSDAKRYESAKSQQSPKYEVGQHQLENPQ